MSSVAMLQSPAGPPSTPAKLSDRPPDSPSVALRKCWTSRITVSEAPARASAVTMNRAKRRFWPRKSGARCSRGNRIGPTPVKVPSPCGSGQVRPHLLRQDRHVMGDGELMVAGEGVHVDRGRDAIPAGGQPGGRPVEEVTAAEQRDATLVRAGHVVAETVAEALHVRGHQQVLVELALWPQPTRQHGADLVEDKSRAAGALRLGTGLVALGEASQSEEERPGARLVEASQPEEDGAALRVAPVPAAGNAAEQPAQEAIAERGVQGPTVDQEQRLDRLAPALELPRH